MGLRRIAAGGGRPVGRLLLISPSFFGYEKDIAAAWQRAAWEVDLVDERPSNLSVVRAALRVQSRLTDGWVRRYYRRLLSAIEGRSYNLVLVVKGEVVPAWFMEQVRTQNPTARFAYYAYDRIGADDNCLGLFPLMDDVYSFDRADVERYGLRYKPLFFVPEFRVGDADARTFDVSFVGTLHSNRYSFVTSITDAFPRSFCYFYVQAVWFFFVKKYLAREFAAVPWSAVSFRKLGKEDVARIFRGSRAVLDVQRFGQSGLTMRTFEVLASGALLVTGNGAVREEPFYSADRILVVGSAEDATVAERLRVMLEGFDPSVPEGFEAYSVDNWIKEFVADGSEGGAA